MDQFPYLEHPWQAAAEQLHGHLGTGDGFRDMKRGVLPAEPAEPGEVPKAQLVGGGKLPFMDCDFLIYIY
jgi:hypothetical protein